MPSSLHQRQQRQKPLVDAFPLSPLFSSFKYVFPHRTSSLFGRSALFLLLSLILLLGVFIPWIRPHYTLFLLLIFLPLPLAGLNSSSSRGLCGWKEQHHYSLWGEPTLSTLPPKLAHRHLQTEASGSSPSHCEHYATLYTVNQKCPGLAVLIPPVPDAQTAHKFGSQGFFNSTSQRPRHLLDILKLGYNVMYNDVDMVWLADPFPYLEGHHDVYFTDDMAIVTPLNHPHSLPQPGKKGRTYICSCMIFLHPTDGAKAVLMKWIEELQLQPWSKKSRSNDHPAFNWALNKTAGQVDMYCCFRLLSHPEACTSKMKHGSRQLKGNM